MLKNLINHIVLVVDNSGSMQSREKEVVTVFDNQIAHLAKRSKELDQETRVSVYLFNHSVSCLVYDMDVLRLPSLAKHYHATGSTALVDGTMQALKELKLTPELYNDHSFLVYVLTDGEENASTHEPSDLKTVMSKMPDNWTIACMVPDAQGVAEAKKFGFPADNIAVWSTVAGGVEKAGSVIQDATEAFMKGRASGVRSTKSLFRALDISTLSTQKVIGNLNALDTTKFVILKVKKPEVIREFVQASVGTYVKGNAYYQLTKTEEVQHYKEICVRDKRNGKVYAGGAARKMLNLPSTMINLKPANMGNWDVFISSSSINRKLAPGTDLIVMK